MSRLWWHVKRWWAWLWGSGSVVVTIRLRELNYHRFERACLLVGLDPDDVRSGDQGLQDAEIGDVHETGPRLMRLLCENDETLIDVLERADKPVAEHICAQLLTRFFFRCVKQWGDRAESFGITPSAARSTVSSNGSAPTMRSGGSSPR